METDVDQLLTPAVAVEKSGLSIETLRYYESEGLILHVARTESGHRRYTHSDIEWIEILRCLRLTGMSIQQMKTFAALVHEGEQTQPARYDQLRDHRELVVERISELQEALVVIDRKIEIYRSILSKKGAP